MKRYEDAKTQFTNVLGLAPDNFVAENNLAWVLAQLVRRTPPYLMRAAPPRSRHGRPRCSIRSGNWVAKAFHHPKGLPVFSNPYMLTNNMGNARALRLLAWGAVAVFAAMLWMPRPLVHSLPRGSPWLEAAFCALVAVMLTEAFAIRSHELRVGRRVLQLAVMIVLLCGVIEVGKIFAGRSASLPEFLRNGAAAIVGVVVLFNYRRYQAPPRMPAVPPRPLMRQSGPT
jgi:VanZ family protein